MRRPSSKASRVGLLFYVVVIIAGASGYLAWGQSVPYPVDTWAHDSAVSTGTGNLGLGRAKLHPGIGMAADGQGGAIIAWDDQNHPPIMSQHLDAAGTSQWAAAIPVTQDPTIQGSPIAVSDGAGGAIIAWFDRRYAIPSTLNTGTLFVQRLDSAGNRLWNKDGVLVTATFGNPQYYSMVSDGNGGAIVVWEGNTEQDNCCRVIAQRIDANGTPVWTEGGVPLTAVGPNYLTAIKTVSDVAGGAIVAFVSPTTVVSHAVPIEVQRISSNGVVLWNANGVSVGQMESAYNYDFDFIADGAGGAILAWDAIAANSPAIVAQRFSSDGNLLWDPDGVPLTSGGGNRVIADLTADGTGGAAFIWDDSRNDPSDNHQDCYDSGRDCDIYAQHLGADGNPLWAGNGVPVVVAPDAQFRGQLVPSNDGSFLAMWSDCRDAPDILSCSNYMKLYTQVLTSSGTPFGPLNGVPISTAPWNQGSESVGEQGWPSFARIADGLGGAILAWPDGRNALCDFGSLGSNCDLYAQRIGVPGTIGMPNSTPTTTPTATATVAPTPSPVIAALSIQPVRLELGKGAFAGVGVAVGKPKYLTIENPRTSAQNATIVIENINILPVYGDLRTGLHYPFSVPPEQCIGPLAPGAKCQLAVSYTPPLAPVVPYNARPDSGVIAIVNNGSKQPTIPVSATATLRDIRYKPHAINFGRHKFLTTSASISVTMTNSNAVAVDLGGVGTQGGLGSFPCFSVDFENSSCYDATSARFVVTPNGSCTIAVAYTPSKIGSQSGRLFVRNYSGPVFRTVRLEGIGTR